MLLLNVPYVEKDEAKELGARWNPKLKKWYVRKKEDYPKFAKWIVSSGDIVVCDWIYLLEGRQECFKCKHETRVIGFGLENYYEFEDGEMNDIECSYYSDVIRIVGPIDPIPNQIMEFIQHHYNYKERYSSTTGQSGISNCCDNCDVLQGDFYLFSEVDSPFFIDSEEKIENLKIYRIPLVNDFALSASIIYGSNDEYIKKLGNIQLLNVIQ